MAGNATVVAHMRKIGAICRDTYGLRVVEVSGWTTRGRSSTFTPRFTIEHHTAAPVDITAMLINGRPDLSGPLCNFELRKDGTVGLLASGRANHAGVASVSSSESYGIEATGPVPTGATGVAAFPNYGAYVKLVAAICTHHGWGMDRVKAHKEIAPTRKIDPVFDMDAFRRAVTAAMAGQPPEEDDMTPEQARQLEAIFKALIVPGTTNPEDTMDMQFFRMREVQKGLIPQGTRSVGEAYGLLYARVRNVEAATAQHGAKLDEILQLLTAPTPP